MALIPDPELLILDEPTQGMDVEGRRGFWQAIREDAASGRTIVFATHYLEEADAYADRIVLISKGQIVADGTAAEVKGLASGRTIRATLPGADEAALRAMPGADGVEVRGDTVLIHCGDSDAVARRLLNQTPARDLEITSRGLEDAFLALTGDAAAGRPARARQRYDRSVRPGRRPGAPAAPGWAASARRSCAWRSAVCCATGGP